MADNMVAGLFGLTPEMYGEQQRISALNEGINLAKLNPSARGTAMIYGGAKGLGNAIGGLMGVEDPMLNRITKRQQILGMIDPSKPETFDMAVQFALQSGDAEAAYALREQSTQARMQAMKNEDYLTQRGQRMQTQGLEGIAQNLITQLKNPDGSVNEEVKNKLMSFPQGQAAISQFAKVIPDLRRIGAMGALEDNPFKVFLEDQTIPKTVQTLAKQYSTSLEKGILDPEKVDVKTKELAEMTQRISQFEQNQTQIKNNQDMLASLRSQGLENSRQSLLIQQGNQALQTQNIAFQQDMKRAEAERKEEAARNKPLPANLAKSEEEDFDIAKDATNLATDSYNYINRIKLGEIKFSLKDRASIAARRAFGSEDSDVVARDEYDKFIKRLTNETLRLNKGVQTDFDYKNALEEIKTSESPTVVANTLNKLVELNSRRVQNANESILRRRANANYGPPQVGVSVPKFEIQIVTQEDYNRFLANPKYPSGTIFINAKGERMAKP
jgi:hypothetical protein